MRIGRVVSSEVGKNRDGDSDVLLLTVEISEPGDEQTVEYMQAAGDDFNPPEDTTVIVADLGEAWKIAIAADDGIAPESASGEKEIYAILAGIKKGRLKCNLDGTVQAGISLLDFVAQAGKVLTELQSIKTAFDSHVHTTTATVGAGAVPGVISPPSTGATPPVPVPMPAPNPVPSANLKSED